jgi:hypothetical protein
MISLQSQVIKTENHTILTILTIFLNSFNIIKIKLLHFQPIFTKVVKSLQFNHNNTFTNTQSINWWEHHSTTTTTSYNRDLTIIQQQQQPIINSSIIHQQQHLSTTTTTINFWAKHKAYICTWFKLAISSSTTQLSFHLHTQTLHQNTSTNLPINSTIINYSNKHLSKELG